MTNRTTYHCEVQSDGKIVCTPAEEKDEARRSSADCSAIPDILFDGFAVYSELKDREKTYTTPENVSAVLDAVVRILRQNAEVTHPESKP